MFRLAADRTFFDWAVVVLGLAAIVGSAAVVFLHNRAQSVDRLRQDTIDAQNVRIAQLKDEVERLRALLDE